MTTYYVDNGSATASDSNAGTSIDAPLLSLAGVEALNLQPGDLVAFMAGTTYTADVANGAALSITANGTASDPITFTSYGTGAKPIINNSSSATYSDAIELKGSSYVVINGLETAQASQAGINIMANSSHITVQNVEDTNVGEGVLVNGTNNLITQNYFHDLHMVVDTPTSVNANDDYGANGVVVGGSNNEISYNRIVNAEAQSYDYGHDGGAIELYGAVSNISIHDNYVQNSDDFIEAAAPSGQMTNVSVYNNVSLNNGPFLTVHNGGVYANSFENFNAYGNTIVNQLNTAAAESTIMLDGPATTSQVNFYDNVVSLNNGDSVFKQEGNYHSNNTFYLQSASTHLYNDYGMKLGTGETLIAGTAPPALSTLIADAMSASDLAKLPAATASTADPTAVPVVTTMSQTVLHGTSLNVASLFTAADPSQHSMTEYQIIDVNSTQVGHLAMNGVTQADGQVIDVSAAQLANLTFTAGYGSDEINVRAFDGTNWSGWTAATVIGADIAPTITAANQTVSHTTIEKAAQLFKYSDGDGDAAVTYEVEDTSTAATSGHFSINGVAQANGQVFDLTAAQLATLTYSAGIGNDTLQVRAYDGAAWGTWTTFGIGGTNTAPVIAAQNTSIAHHGTLAAASLFSVTDADNDTITQYQLEDLNSATDGGHFAVNGVVQASDQLITLTAAQLAQTTFVAGSGADNVQVRASDGITWSNWDSFTITAPVNSAPVVTGLTQTLLHGTSVAAASLASVTDANQDAITEYQFEDLTTTSTSGSLVLNGVTIAAGQVVDVTAAQLSQLQYLAGTTGASISVRAFDGLDWSNWSTATITASAPPVVTAKATTIAHNGTVAASSLFGLTLATGDSVTQYQIEDLTSATDSGHFVVNGVVQLAGQVITLTAAQLAQTTFVAGSGADNFEIRASNGVAWSNWSSATITAPVNSAPVVTGLTQTLLHGTSVAAASLASVTDANQDAITEYQFEDLTTTSTSGSLVLNGVTIAAGQVVDVTAAQLSQLQYLAGTTGASISVRAFDGLDWSSWSTATITASAPPVVTAKATTIAHNGTVAASSLFGLTLATGDSVTQYQIEDLTSATDSGHFVVNGVVQSAGQVITLTAAQLAQTTFVAGSGADNFEIRASNGVAWSNWSSATITAPVNSAPVVTAVAQSVTHGKSIGASSLFSATDADKDAIVEYQFEDLTTSSTSGSLILNGTAIAAGQVVDVTAAQLSQLQFQAGTTNASIEVRASDGLDWSAWSTTVVTSVNHAPTVAAANTTIGHNATVAASSLFKATDADGDAIVEYQIANLDYAVGAGSLKLNGVVEVAGQTVDVTAANLSTVTYQAGSGADQIEVRAFDGLTWGAWTTMTITAPVDSAPVVAPTNMTITANSTTGARQLFTVTDAEADPVTKYEIVDYTSTATSGHFVVNGVAVAANQVVDLTAAQLSNATYVAGTTSDSLSIRAYDGLEWGAWTTFSVVPTQATAKIAALVSLAAVTPAVTEADSAPTVTTTNVIIAHNAEVALTSLFSANDVDGDAIVSYQVTDTASDGGHLIVNGVAQAANTTVTLTADQLADVMVQAGSGTDTLQISASDGMKWSLVQTATVSTGLDHAPVVTAGDLTVAHGATVAAASLFSVTDADGDAITQYHLSDLSTNADSGHFVVGGVVEAAGTVLNLTAAQLAQTTFVAGSGGDTIQDSASDGTAWSNVAVLTTQTPVNHAPVVTASAQSYSHDTAIAASTLFSTTDADGDAIQSYQVEDLTSTAGSGSFEFNGQTVAKGQVLTVSAAQLANLTFETGSTVTDALTVRAFDGSDWSKWTQFSVTPTNAPPVVAANVNSAIAPNTSVVASSLVSVTDPNHDVITEYQVVDWSSSATAGHFVSGHTVSTPGHVMDLTAAQFAAATFVSGGSAANDVIQVRASDGLAWGSWAEFHV